MTQKSMYVNTQPHLRALILCKNIQSTSQYLPKKILRCIYKGYTGCLLVVALKATVFVNSELALKLRDF